MAKIRINIDGLGTVKVKVPKPLTAESLGDSLASAVEQTLELVYGGNGFHPAMGYLLKEEE